MMNMLLIFRELPKGSEAGLAYLAVHVGRRELFSGAKCNAVEESRTKIRCGLWKTKLSVTSEASS
jgi:hypothetical protein